MGLTITKPQRRTNQTRVYLRIVHDNGLPRWELQPTVPLVGRHSFLILRLKLKTQVYTVIYNSVDAELDEAIVTHFIDRSVSVGVRQTSSLSLNSSE